MHKRVKVEDVHSEVAIIQPTAETSASDDSDSSSTTSHHPPPRMTLSERLLYHFLNVQSNITILKHFRTD